MSPTIQLVVNVVLIVALVVWIGIRQMTWRPVDAGRMWRLPVILAVVGAVTLGGVTGPRALTGVDVSVVVVELAISLGLGAMMGAIATIRPMTPEGVRLYRESRAADRRQNPASVVLETRTGWLGMVLWLVLIGVRVGMDILASIAGSHLAAATGVILLVVAANRLARIAVILYRAGRMVEPARV